MTASLYTNDELEQIQNALGLVDRRSKEDFVLFFRSAYEHYVPMVASYVKRNASFFADSIFVTLSHATNPIKNPQGFGLAFGSFVGLLSKAEDANVCKSLFSNVQTYKFIEKTIKLFESVKGFDMNSLKLVFVSMDVSLLEPEELEKFNNFVK